MYERIPQYLKDNAHFCLWKYEKRNGKQTKVPYYIDGKRADSTNVSDFATFSEVLSVFETGDYSGIGMMVYDGISAIDIDNCVNNGKLSEMVTDIIDIINSYTEYSPSGKGVRIICLTDTFYYDRTKYYINNRKKHIEIYVAENTEKFVTLTGNVINNMGIENRTDEVKAIMEKYMFRPVTVKASSQPTGSYLSDDSVITIASNAINGEKFRKLWKGEISEYPSHSEAELALCSKLVSSKDKKNLYFYTYFSYSITPS